MNPIPVLLNKVVLEYIPKYGQRLADEVRKWGRWIKEQAEAELAAFYPKDKDIATPIAYLWARTILSEAPTEGHLPIEVPLMRSLWLAKKAGRRRALRWVRDDKGAVRTQIVEVTYFEDGQPFAAPEAATWQATGGKIDAAGLFVAGAAAGVHTAKAVIGSLDAVAEVRITEPSAGAGAGEGRHEGSGGEGRAQKIVWSGEVKSQKWMNLYTKVLSKFANVPGLKIVVQFDVPLEGEQAKAAAEQARTGLRELGLNDDVRQD